MSDPIVAPGSGVTTASDLADASETPSTPPASSDKGAEVKAALTEGIKAEPKAEQPAAPTKKSYKFKIDDQEVTEELTEEDLVKAYQKSKGADKRFQEAADVKARTARLLQQLKEDPFKLLQHEQLYGKDARAKVEEWLWNQIQLEKMDPKERESLEMKEKLRQYEDQEKARAEESRVNEQKALREHYAKEIDKEITDAIKAAGKQVTPYYFKRVAHYMSAALSQGKHVAAKDVVSLVDQDLQNDLRAMFGSSSEEQVLQLLGDPVLEKVRRADLMRAKGQFTKKEAPVHDDKAPIEEKKKDSRELEKRTSLFDWE